MMKRLDTAAAYALNALPPDEAAAFERSIADDKYLTEDLASFRRVATELSKGLPDIVPAASPELWDRISREAGINPASEPELESPVPVHRWDYTYLASAAAVVAVVAIAVASLLAIRGPAAADARTLALAAAADPTATSIDLANPDGFAEMGAEVVIAADGTGYVIADSLPVLDADRTYQLWLIVDDRVISAGILGNDPDVVQFRAEGDIAGIAISNEIAGGVVVSEVPPVAIWLRDA